MNTLQALYADARSSKVFPLMLLVGVYYFLQGIGGNPGFHLQALELFLKNNLGLTVSGQASFMFLITIPWMIKPLYGLLSDSVPIFGYRRKSYFFIASLLSLGAYILISFFGYSYTAILTLYFIAMVGYACSDVLCDAVMVERGKPLQATDRLQSAQWLSIACAGVLVSFSGGYIAEYLSFQNAILISAIAPCIVIFVTARFLTEEKSVSVADASKRAWRGVKEALTMKPIWGCAIFLFLYNMQPGLGTALYNYQIDVLKFTQIQIGHIGTVSEICFIAGALAFAAFCSKLSEKVLLNGIIAVGCLTTLAYLFYNNLTNAFIVSGATSFVGVITFLGVLTLAARVCPQNAEGTVFALLMSTTNFGGKVGNIIGANIYEKFQYDWLVIISSLFIACMWFFLPLVHSKPIGMRVLVLGGGIAALSVGGFLLSPKVF